MADDLEKAREALNRQWDKQIGGLFGQAKSITSAVEAFVNAILSSREEKAGAAGLVEARSEIEQAKKYATMLFASLAPHCQPMGDLIGILTQIDNATTVIPTLNARIAELERERDGLKEHIRIHAGDTLSLNNEAEDWKDRAEKAEAALAVAHAAGLTRGSGDV